MTNPFSTIETLVLVLLCSALAAYIRHEHRKLFQRDPNPDWYEIGHAIAVPLVALGSFLALLALLFTTT